MATGSTRLSGKVKDLLENIKALENFSFCLDRKFRGLKNWEHVAFTLDVRYDVIQTCKIIYHEYSPTIRLFEYLSVIKPDMTIYILRDVFQRNESRQRCDIVKYLLKDFGDDDKVSEVITNSSSNILDEIACRLDTAERPTCNWKDFGLELGIQRDELQRFEMYTNYNPTEALFRYLYTTSKKNVKMSTIVGFLEEMQRNDVLEEIRKICQSTDPDPDAKDVLRLGSQILETTSQKLNCEGPSGKNWRVFAEHLLKKNYFDDPDIICKLEPPRPDHVHSPTKKMIEWLAANKPRTKITWIYNACKKIDRDDAVDVLLEFFSTANENDDDDISDYSSLPFGLQETPEKDNILKGKSRSFGFETPTAEYPLRKNERDDLVTQITSCDLLVLHAPTGYGKTSLVASVADELMEHHEYTCIYVNSKNVFSLVDLAVKTLTTCGIPAPPSQEKERLKELFKNLNRKSVLIFDNFDHMFHASDPLSSRGSIATNNTMNLTMSPGNQPDLPMSTSFPTMNTTSSDEYSGIPATLSQSLENMPATSNDSPGSSRTKRTVFGLLPWEVNPQKDDFQNFLIELIKCVPKNAPHFAILATTWESFTTTKVVAKQTLLTELCEKDSRELFLHKCKSVLGLDESDIPNDRVEEIIKCCCGIPLLLSTATVFIESFDSFESGAKDLLSSPLEERASKLSMVDLPCEERFNHCLSVCFDRLDEPSKEILVILSVIPGPFTKEMAMKISKKTLDSVIDQALSTLRRFSFLRFGNGHYYMSSAIRSVVIKTAMKEDAWKTVLKDALFEFLDYSFATISEIDELFFTQSCQDAIQAYRKQEENLREISRWCISDKILIDNDVKKRIIQNFAKCYWINMKLMKTHLLKIIICKFAQICKNIDDPKHYIESLIFGGATFVKGCLCAPNLCPRALDKAMWCFKTAIREIHANQPTNTSGGKWTDIVFPRKAFRRINSRKKCVDSFEAIKNCDIISDEAKSELLVKYGKCLARAGWDYGLSFVEAGIEVRQRTLKKDSTNPKSCVMVALGYSDLACACSYVKFPNNVPKSIEIREQIVLPVYEKCLGFYHPFTSSALSHVSRAHLATQNYDQATKTCEAALQNRQTLLGDHHETASSLFDLGQILSEQASVCDDPDRKQSLYEKSLENLEKSLEMRKRLAYTPEETAQTHHEIALVLNRLGREDEAEKAFDEAYFEKMKVDDNHLHSAC